MKTILSLALLMSLAVGCASNKAARQEVQEKVSQEKTTGGRDFFHNVLEIINTSETLNADQKQKLRILVTDIGQKNKALFEESFKLRSVLLKELVSGKVHQKEVRILKKKIKKTEGERISNIFSGIDKISAIVSNDPGREKIMQEFLQIDHIR